MKSRILRRMDTGHISLECETHESAEICVIKRPVAGFCSINERVTLNYKNDRDCCVWKHEAETGL